MELRNYIWYVVLIFILLVVGIVTLKINYKDLMSQQQINITQTKEGFTAAVAGPGETDSKPWPLAYDSGFKPLVSRNKNYWSVKKLAVLGPGSVSHLIGRYFQRKIYPVELQVKPSTITIISGLSDASHTNNTGFDIGFVREQLLLDMSRIESGIKSVSVLAPAYWETLYLIGNKHTSFASLAELKRKTRDIADTSPIQPATQKIGVLRDSLPYWQAITRALELEIGQDYLKAESEDLAQLLQGLESREVDAVFMIAHTFDSRLQAFLKTNETRMISIYPRSKYPQETDMLTRPYNPDTTDLITKFRSDMKVYVPWIFEETVELGKAVGLKKQLSVDSVLGNANTAGSSIYKTFKVRTYLCTSRQLGRDSDIIGKLGRTFLEEYQSLGLLIDEWGHGGKSRNEKQGGSQPNQLVLPTLVFADYDSFNPDMLGAVPTEIDLNPFMRDLIARIYGRIKIENPELSCDI